jgi:hypothetical protein
MVLAGFIFYAFVTAMSRLLVMREIPEYITHVTSGISNLFTGAFGK